MTKDHKIHGTDQPNDLCWRHQIKNQKTIQRSRLYVAASDKQSWKQCSCASKNTNCTEGRSHKNDVELWQMRLHETCGASAYVLAAKKDTKHPSPPEKPMYPVPCCAKRIATLWFLALLPFQQRHTRVNKQKQTRTKHTQCYCSLIACAWSSTHDSRTCAQTFITGFWIFQKTA